MVKSKSKKARSNPMLLPGRRLGDGNESSARDKMAVSDNDDFFLPSESSSDDEFAEDALPEEKGVLDTKVGHVSKGEAVTLSRDIASADGEGDKVMGTVDKHGNVTRFERDEPGHRTEVKEAGQDEAIQREEGNTGLKGPMEVDVKNTDLHNADTKKSTVVPCKNGHLKLVGEKLVPLSEKELSGLPLEECECPVCQARAKNTLRKYPRGTTRSGGKRGIYKFGEGHVLGESGSYLSVDPGTKRAAFAAVKSAPEEMKTADDEAGSG